MYQNIPKVLLKILLFTTVFLRGHPNDFGPAKWRHSATTAPPPVPALAWSEEHYGRMPTTLEIKPRPSAGDLYPLGSRKVTARQILVPRRSTFSVCRCHLTLQSWSHEQCWGKYMAAVINGYPKY